MTPRIREALSHACAVGLAALLLAGGSVLQAAEPVRREIVVVQELTPAVESALPLADLRTALEVLPRDLSASDRLALVVFDAKARVVQRLDDPVAGLPAKLSGLAVCADGASCYESDPAVALAAARELFKGRPAGAERQIVLVSSGAPCQFEVNGPAPAGGGKPVRSTTGISPLSAVKAARELRKAGVRITAVVFPKERGAVCLPRGSQLDVRGNLIARQYAHAVSGGGPALIAGEGRSFAELLAAALAPAAAPAR